MKALVPKSFESLSPKQKELIQQMMNQRVLEMVDAEHAEVQKVYMKLCCILLHNAFGFGEKRLYMFLGNWKNIYRWNNTFPDKESQTKALDAEMTKIFKDSGYPEDFINTL